MDVLIGTSGYSYSWNKAKPSAFEWYIAQGFNSVEINATFYRLPTMNLSKTWSKAPSCFKFSIKVHRSITHYSRLGANAIDLFIRFRDLLKPIEDKVRFWLFQMPPSFSYKEEHVSNIKDFVSNFNERERFVFEFRDNAWWKYASKMIDLGIVFCSVDAPDLPRDIITSNDVIYLRLHGRYRWYSYLYQEDELNDIINRIYALNPRELAIYLNNDYGMLTNGIYLLNRLTS